MKAIEHINSTHTVIHDADLEYDPKDIKEMRKITINFGF